MSDQSPSAPMVKTLAFYPRRPDGSSPTFCLADIADSEAEFLFVRQMFDTHDSAVLVEVFEDETLLRRYKREDVATQEGCASPGHRVVRNPAILT